MSGSDIGLPSSGAQQPSATPTLKTGLFPLLFRAPRCESRRGCDGYARGLTCTRSRPPHSAEARYQTTPSKAPRRSPNAPHPASRAMTDPVFNLTFQLVAAESSRLDAHGDGQDHRVLGSSAWFRGSSSTCERFSEYDRQAVSKQPMRIAGASCREASCSLRTPGCQPGRCAGERTDTGSNGGLRQPD